MKRILNKIKEFLLDPLGVKQVLQHINMKAAELKSDIYHTHMRSNELVEAVNAFEKRIEDHQFLQSVRAAMDTMMPDMLWAKDIYGRYIIANKAIRDTLLQDPNPYGKNDVEIARAIKERMGDDKHTFGEICGNSDKIVLTRDMPMKFNEDGLINGEYIMLQVHKNTLKNSDGYIIGTVGIGRDITFEVTMLRDIADMTTCPETKKQIETLLNYFEYKDRT